MKITKKKIDSLEKCYSIASLDYGGEKCFLVAAEKHAPCYLYREDGKRIETVWTEPGGVMTMLQLPGRSGAFLATHQFYSPNDSKEAKLVYVRREKDAWKVTVIAKVPFIHRFGILTRGDIHYLIVCCLKSGHEYKEDWSMPGHVLACQLPDELDGYSEEAPLELAPIMTGMLKNHGYSLFRDGEQDTAIVTCEEGVFQFVPPENPETDWTIRKLYGAPVSDAVLFDLDGDGVPELGCISPFHGDRLYICRKQPDGSYSKVWEYDEPLEMLHATWACTILGQPCWIVGHRKGKRDLLMVRYEDGQFTTTVIDRDCGSANVYHFVNGESRDIIISANRETDEVAMYYFDPD